MPEIYRENDQNTYVWVKTSLINDNTENGAPIYRKRGIPGKNGTSSIDWGWMKGIIVSSTGIRTSMETGGSRRTLSQRRQYGGFQRGNASQNQNELTIKVFPNENQYSDSMTLNVSASNLMDGSIVMDNAFSNDLDDQGEACNLPPDDLIHMTHLHEPAIVECLRLRYQQNLIYTCTGPILLALNPFKKCDDLYGEECMQRYYERGAMLRLGGTDKTKLPPHVYAISDEAFRRMIQTLEQSNMQTGTGQADQSILVSGESGAGKTVTTKFIMAYLASLSERQHLPPSHSMFKDCNSSLMSGEKGSVEQQVLQSNPILESFGNARTIRNDNSSRFGKYISLQFCRRGVLLGASIHTYLLEKVRLVNQAPGERNYHIFYELLEGAHDPKERYMYFLDKLKEPTEFKMLSSSGTFDRRDKVRDKDTFKDLKKAMKTMGIHNKEQRDILSVACALMHFSNLNFIDSGNSSSASVLDKSVVSLSFVLKLLGVTHEGLEKALCSCTIEVAREKLVKTLTVDQAIKATEALIKATYGALFTFLVKRINGCIQADTNGVHGRAESKAAYIGVLDIFGFESFALNSFEQLCINYCNEALQQQFNRFVFKLEQQEYELEGIEWSFISFPDNQDVLDLIDERRTGILSVLDEQCRLARCTDKTFASAVLQSCKDHSRFLCSTLQQGAGKFTIEHYAGPVEYSVVNFIEKNKDELPQEGTELLLSSSNPFVHNLAFILGADPELSTSTPSIKRSNSSLSRVSVGSQFCSQLCALRERIERTSPHYIRCLKPNDLLVPDTYDPSLIVDQLRCAGVLEAVRVSRVGFPQRYVHKAFVDRYKILALTELKEAKRLRKDLCTVLVATIENQMTARHTTKTGHQTETIRGDGIQRGKTKIFLQKDAFDALERLRSLKLEHSAIKIQAASRCYVTRTFFQIQIYCVVLLQSFHRAKMAKAFVTEVRRMEKAKKLQKAWRKTCCLRRYSSLKFIALEFQRRYRGIRDREKFRKILQCHKAQKIQAFTRMSLLRARHIYFRRAVVTVQCLVRCKKSRKVISDLREEANDLKKVSDERDNLRAEVERMKGDLAAAQKAPPREKLSASTMHKELHFAQENAYEENIQEEKGGTSGLKDVATNQTTAPAPGGCIEKFVLSASTVYRDFPSNPTGLQMELTRVVEESLKKDQEIINLRREVERLRRALDGDSLIYHAASQEADKRFGAAEHPQISGKTFTSPFQKLQTLSVMVLPRLSQSQEAEETYQEKGRVGSAVTSPKAELSVGMHSAAKVLLSGSKFLHDHLVSPHPTWEDPDLSDSEWRDDQSLSHDGIAQSLAASSTFIVSDKCSSAVHEAVCLGETSKVALSLEHAVDVDVEINQGDEEGRAPIHIAVMKSHAEIVRALIEHSAMCNAQDVMGNTPLHYARDVEMMKILIEQGHSNPNIPNARGKCVLHQAVSKQDFDAVRYLVDKGADVDVADDVQWLTPLHLIMTAPRSKPELNANDQALVDIAKILCKRASDVNAKDSEGNTPMHAAAKISHNVAFDLLDILISNHGDPNIVNKNGQTPLLLLCHNVNLRKQEKFYQMVENFSSRSEPCTASKSGCTPLHLALYHQDIECAEILVRYGADLNASWHKPKKWEAFWDDSTPVVLPFDMVRDQYSLRRLISAVKKPQTWAMARPFCMECKTQFGTFVRNHHCRHCGRLVCGPCSSVYLDESFFPELFVSMGEVKGKARVCCVCEDVLLSRKKRNEVISPMNATTKRTQH